MVEKINLNSTSSVQKLNTFEIKNNKAKERNTLEPPQVRTTFSKEASKGSRALASATIKKPNVQGGVVFENGKAYRPDGRLFSGKIDKKIKNHTYSLIYHNGDLLVSQIDGKRYKTYEEYSPKDSMSKEGFEAVRIIKQEKDSNKAIVQSFKDGTLNRIYDETTGVVREFSPDGLLAEHTLVDGGKSGSIGSFYDLDSDKTYFYDENAFGRVKKVLETPEAIIVKYGYSKNSSFLSSSFDPVYAELGRQKSVDVVDLIDKKTAQKTEIIRTKGAIGATFEDGKDNVSFEILEEKYPLSYKRKLVLKSISPNFDDLNRSLLERKIIINQDGEIEKATKEILGAGLFENGRKDDKLSKEEASKMAHQMAKCFNIAEEFGLSKKDFSSQDGLFNLSYNQTKDYFNQIIAYISRMD